MRSTRMLLVVLAIFVFPALLATSLAAQTTWWVQSADWGYKNQRQDVTNTVKRLVNGPNFQANNANMGVDPAKGKDKTLRIVAKDSRGTVRDFYYKEGSTVNAQMFSGGPNSGYPGWGGKPGWNGGDNYRELRIVSANWAAGSQSKGVTRLLQGRIRNNRLSITANVQTLGDPAVGKAKTLTVYYSYGEQRRTAVVQEGQTLNLPQ